VSLTDAVARLPFAEPAFEPGHVWLAGAGPGGLGCVTLDVVSAIACADAIVYDALVDPALLDAGPQAARHFVGKRGGSPSTPQAEIDALLVRLAREKKRVLRLKGGDPNLFGRGGEEAQALFRAGIPFRFLPGLTSGLAALAEAGIPATMRGTNKAIILATGHAAGEADDIDWAALAATGQPLVIYMGMGRIERIAQALVSGGLAPATPAAIVMSATTAGERILTSDLGNLAAAAREAGFGSPGLIVVGEIVALRQAMQPKESRS
jgi:uroporphyrin-III C-methyltransferase